MPDIACPVALHARRSPQACAVRDHGVDISYLELDRRVDTLARHFAAKGFGPGSRVGLLARNSLDYIVVLWSLWRAGCVSVLFNHRHPLPAARALAEQLRCAAFVIEDELAGFVAVGPWVDGGAGGSPCFAAGQRAAIVFTSGSQGAPKAALLTCGNFYFNALGAAETVPMTPRDRWLLSLPLFHVGGLGVLWRCFSSGSAVVLGNDEPNPAEVIERDGVTHMSLVPAQLARLLKVQGNVAAARTLKAILLGGAPIPANLLEKAVTAGLAVHVTYGLTEAASQVATSSRLEPGDIAAARVLPYREVKLGAGGELLVRGPVLFAGYERTSGLEKPFDADGWFVTGDTGELDDEGRLRVKGRKDNMFFRGGENIQPEEIEARLMRVPGVDAALVAGKPDEDLGSVPVALVRSAPGAPVSRALLVAQLCRDLPKFKVPVDFFRWPASNGIEPLKVDRPRWADVLISGEGLERIA